MTEGMRLKRTIAWAIVQEGHLAWRETDGYCKPLIFRTRKEAEDNLQLGKTEHVVRVEINA